MPAGKHGRITCPTCKTRLLADTTKPNGTLQIQAQTNSKIATFVAYSRDWFWRRRYVFAIPALLLCVMIFINLQTAQTPTQTAPLPRVEEPPFEGTEEPLPANGKALFCLSETQCQPLPTDSGNATAPFEVKVAGEQNYLVKLKNASSNFILIFVRANSDLTVDVPLGQYALTYAVGTPWYGFYQKHRDYFGPRTAHFKTDRSLSFWDDGETIHWSGVTLYAVPNGNMETYAIPASEF